MKEIKLSQCKIVLVDDENYDYLNQFKWYAVKHHNTYYAARQIRLDNGKQKTILMHRTIMNTPIDKEVDHIDHNGLNCLESNMRNCTHSENKMNVIPCGTVKYLGVDVNHGKFRAAIKVKGKCIHIGLFKNKEDAAKAYDIKAKYYHGEFANLNFKS